MDLALTVHRSEMIQAIQGFLPMRLYVGKLEGSDDAAWVQIDAVETTSFVPHHGLRLSCAASIHYPLPLLPDDFTVQHASMEMVPAIVDSPNGPVLAFKLSLGDFDLKYLPNFVDRSVAKRINDALRENATSIAWDFSSTLSRIVELPERLRLVRTMELEVQRSDVQVTEEAIVLELSVDACFHHTGAAPDQGEPTVVVQAPDEGEQATDVEAHDEGEVADGKPAGE